MDHFAPGDWSSNMGDAMAPFSGEDDGLVELLWRSGQVVMQSQAPPRPAVREQEEAPWFQYSVANDDDGSLEKDLFSEIFAGIPADGPGGPCKEEDGEERGAAVTALWGGLIPTPLPTEKAGFWGDDGRGSPASEANESSVVTIGSRSNHAQTPSASLRGGKASDTMSHHDASATLTSLSTWSRPSGASKRKLCLGDGAESLSEVIQDVESESADEPGQKPTTGKRRRVAQVHNLSERRRRDRINEKMRALQELVPHCNKTDKASMLNEAIEYLKSLQLQLQIMWAMDGGMAPAPVMFPAGNEHYMQRMASMRSRMPPFRTCLYSSNDAEKRILRDR